MRVTNKHMAVEGEPAELKLIAEALSDFANKHAMDLPKTIADLRFAIECEYREYHGLGPDDWDFIQSDKEELGIEDGA
jgi:hypothetical protein